MTLGLCKILVVDDNPIIQRVVYFALRDKGFLVLMSGTIADGLHIIRQQKPDLILLDLNFPVKDGGFGGAAWDGFAAIEWLQRTSHSNQCVHNPICMNNNVIQQWKPV